MNERRGIQLLVLLFLFGFTMSSLTFFLLLFPGSFLDYLWRLNPRAQVSFRMIGDWAILLMAIVAAACLIAAIGLANLRPWARIFAITILAVNLIGDLSAAVVRHELATLIGLPIAGAMIYYLMTTRVRGLFESQSGRTRG